jgi:hypothetical protein
MVENNLEKKIKVVCNDNGDEFTSKAFKDHYKAIGASNNNSIHHTALTQIV